MRAFEKLKKQDIRKFILIFIINSQNTILYTIK